MERHKVTANGRYEYGLKYEEKGEERSARTLPMETSLPGQMPCISPLGYPQNGY